MMSGISCFSRQRPEVRALWSRSAAFPLSSGLSCCIQATEEDGSSDEDLDDEAMMELDKSLAALFSEQKKKTQAKKDEKTKLQKEKTLVRDFKIKVSSHRSVLQRMGLCSA